MMKRFWQLRHLHQRQTQQHQAHHRLNQSPINNSRPPQEKAVQSRTASKTFSRATTPSGPAHSAKKTQRSTATERAEFIREMRSRTVSIAIDTGTICHKYLALVSLNRSTATIVRTKSLETATSVNIVEEIKKLVLEFRAAGINVASVTADNASNMTKALKDVGTELGLAEVHCAAHIIQLLVKGVLYQDADVLAAIEVLEEKVYPTGKVHKGVVTRWNYELYAMQETLKKKDEMQPIVGFTAMGVIEKAEKILRPFGEYTNVLQSDSANVYHYVDVVGRMIELCSSGQEPWKSTVLENLKQRIFTQIATDAFSLALVLSAGIDWKLMTSDDRYHAKVIALRAAYKLAVGLGIPDSNLKPTLAKEFAFYINVGGGFDSDNADLLTHCQTLLQVHHVLKEMAATESSCERAFSVIKHFVGKKRQRLQPETVDDIAFLWSRLRTTTKERREVEKPKITTANAKWILETIRVVEHGKAHQMELDLVAGQNDYSDLQSREPIIGNTMEYQRSEH